MSRAPSAAVAPSLWPQRACSPPPLPAAPLSCGASESTYCGLRSRQAALASDSRNAPSETGRRPGDAAAAARPHQPGEQHAAAPSGAATCRASAGQAGGRRRGGRARQDMTTAPGDSPPSRISSQPTRRRPRARRNALTRPTNQDCSPNSSARPCSARRAWQRAQPCQRSLGHCARAARPLRAPRARARAAPGPDRGLDHPPCAAGAAAGEAAPGRPPAQRSADLRAAGAYA